MAPPRPVLLPFSTSWQRIEWRYYRKVFIIQETFTDQQGSHNPLAYVLMDTYKPLGVRTEDIVPKWEWEVVWRKDEYLSRFKQEILRYQDFILILSSENFFWMNEMAIKALLTILAASSIKVICYIRKLEEWMLSMAKQMVKIRHASTVDYSINRLLPHLVYGLRAFSCENPVGLHKWMAMVGAENFILRRYDVSNFKGGNIFSDFMDSFNIELTSDFLLPKAKANPSLSTCETLYFKDFLNKLNLKTPDGIIAEQLLKWEKINNGTKFFLPEHVSAALRSEIRAIRHCLPVAIATDYRFYDIAELTPAENTTSFRLSYSALINLLDWCNNHIDGFAFDFLNAFATSQFAEGNGGQSIKLSL